MRIRKRLQLLRDFAWIILIMVFAILQLVGLVLGFVLGLFQVGWLAGVELSDKVANGLFDVLSDLKAPDKERFPKEEKDD